MTRDPAQCGRTALPLSPALWMAGLGAVAVACAALNRSYHVALQARNPGRDDPLIALLGEGRRLFAANVYSKADTYFHRGFTPSMFDTEPADDAGDDAEAHVHQGSAMEDSIAHRHTERCAHDRVDVATDWIARHGRAHFPSTHTHLGDPGTAPGSEREMLPWLLLSTRLDPNRVESYSVTAYWLRRIGKHAEAEDFLREGLRANPNAPELLFELGRSRYTAQDLTQARNLWQTAWRQWQAVEGVRPRKDQDLFCANQILLHLALLESQQGQRERAVQWLETALPLAYQPDLIRARIEQVRAGTVLQAP